MSELTRKKVVSRVRYARRKGNRPNLSSLDLSRLDLSRVDLSDAILRRADLSRANLSGADLSHANLTDATLPDTDKFLQTPFGWAHIRTDYIRIGCQYHRVEEWRGFTDDEISGMASGALDWWRENKDIIFSIVDKLKGKK